MSDAPRVTSDGRSFEVQLRWKEEVVYWEGRRGFLFDAGWGVQPPVLYVPPAPDWDGAVPTWMQGRRDAVVAALEAAGGHVLNEDATGYGNSGAGRTLERD